MNWKTALTLLSMSPAMLLAQTSTTDLNQPSSNDGASPKNSQYEKVEVTGSYIKRVDLEGANPVQTLDRDYLDKTGYNSVGDVMRDLTANSFGSARETSGSGIAGVATVNLRGLGANRTLVLMNGRRLAKDGIGAAADLNLIPMAAVERIDILKAGGSATYGSDAVGGVVNVITRKDYVGSEINLRQEVTELGGGNRTTVSGVYGAANSKGNIVTSFQYRNNQEIFDRDRSWSAEGVSTRSPIPNLDTGSGSRSASGCESFNPDTGRCEFNFADFSTSLPQIQQLNIMSQGEYNINSLTKFHAAASFTRKETIWNYAPGAVALEDVTAPRDILMQDGSTITAGTNIEELLWRSLPLGTRDNEVTTNAVSVNAGVTRYIGDTWEADLTVSTERINRRSEAINGYARRDALTAAIENGTCDVFPGGDTSGCVTDAIRYGTFQETESTLSNVELRTNGELFDLPAGPVGAAIGTQAIYETYDVGVDAESRNNNVAGGGAGGEGQGDRTVLAAFAELQIPVTEKLEAQIAGRFDWYNDFGSTVNPQLNLRYRQSDKLLFRASAGTGFKAPDMQDLYDLSQGFPTFIDEVACANGVAQGCNPQQYFVTNQANPELTEENSQTYNIGVVFQPNKNINASLDFFHVNLENTVGVDPRSITEYELGLRQGGATQAEIDAALANFNTSVVRDGNGEIRSITTRLQNLSQRTVQGLDLNLQYSSDVMSWGDVVVTNNASYLTKYDTQGFPGVPEFSAFTRPGAPRWRNNLNVDYGPTQNFRFATAFRTIGPSEKSISQAGQIDTYTQIDTQAIIRIPSWKATVTLGAINVLGTTPPVDDTSLSDQLDASLYDPIGRRFFAAYTQSF